MKSLHSRRNHFVGYEGLTLDLAAGMFLAPNGSS
jgi:hypothetical protein